METSQLGALIRALRRVTDDAQWLSHKEQIDGCIGLVEGFNKSNEMRFKFEQGAIIVADCSEADKDAFWACLDASWSYLTSAGEPDRANEPSVSRLVVACLNSIRLVSRDTDTIKLFENAQLLDVIQAIAGLKFQEDKTRYGTT